jgi:hypothetical protein
MSIGVPAKEAICAFLPFREKPVRDAALSFG